MTEEWLSIEGYEGLYAISNHGNVMSMNYAKSGLPWLMTSRLRRGYPSVFLRKKGSKGKSFTVHTLVAAAFIGPRPKGMQINHIDGDKTNSRDSNLEYCTPSENKKHAFRIGLESNVGEKHSRARLTGENIVEIRKRYAAGEPVKEIAESFGVHQSNISHIVSGRRWKHIPFGGEVRVFQ